MRTLLFFFSLLLTLPAEAAEWGHYVNERFGVEVDVPPGFEPGPPPENGDGLGFRTATAELRAYGSFLAERDFEDEIRQRIAWLSEDGWIVTYQASSPGWASFSGKKGSRIHYARAIPMCGAQMIGMFELEYSVADLAAFDPVVNRLVHSLKDSGTGWQC